MKKLASLTSAGLLALASAPLAQATLLVYEGFNYGGSGIASINTGGATGTTGNWTVTNTLPSGGLASSAYQTSGLSFGSNFATATGGSLLQTTRYSGTNAQTIANIQLGESAAATGTVWGSYLVNLTAFTNAANATGFATLGVATSAGSIAPNLSTRFNTNTTATTRSTVTTYDAGGTASTASTLATGTTYLVLTRFTNVGNTLSAGAGAGVATSWFFDQTGFDAWVAAGRDEAELSQAGHAFKTQTDTLNAGSISFSSGFITLVSDAGNTNNALTTTVFDELRYGTTLADVTAAAIPEPSTCAAILGGLALAGVAARRRSRAA